MFVRPRATFCGRGDGPRKRGFMARSIAGRTLGLLGGQHGLDGHRVSEVRVIFERPDDLFRGRDLDELRLLGAGVLGIPRERVAIGKALDAGDPGESDTWEIVLFHLPDDFLAGVTSRTLLLFPCR